MKKLLVLVLLLALFAVPADALYSHGTIDNECDYSDFKLSGEYVSMVIENKTDKRIEFYAKLFFLSLFDDVLAFSYINVGYIAPKGEAKYRAAVYQNSGKGAKDAMEIEWQRVR